MHQTFTRLSRVFKCAALKFRWVELAARAQSRRLSVSVLMAALLTLAGIGAAVPSDQVSAPFGSNTVTEFPSDPLVQDWQKLREQIQLDDLIVSFCTEDETDDCGAAKTLMDIVDDARHYQGRALIGHINRSINLMIRPSAGTWMSALDILKLGSGDCKDYSIAKYAALLKAGISPTDVRLVIVHNVARKENHMVVSVYDDGHWLLLDNLTMLLVRDTDKKGYVPIFALDGVGVRRYVSSIQSG
jgi:predicted transglutaminase-like cysteine proteinase